MSPAPSTPSAFNVSNQAFLPPFVQTGSFIRNWLRSIGFSYKPPKKGDEVLSETFPTLGRLRDRIKRTFGFMN